MKVKGLLVRADVPNFNGIVYPKDLLMKLEGQKVPILKNDKPVGEGIIYFDRESNMLKIIGSVDKIPSPRLAATFLVDKMERLDPYDVVKEAKIISVQFDKNGFGVMEKVPK